MTGFSDVYKGLAAFHAAAPRLTDNGVFALYTMSAISFDIRPIYAPGKTKAELDALLEPLTKALAEANVRYSKSTADYPHFIAAYNAIFPPRPVGVSMLTGARIIQRQHVESNNQAITAAFQQAAYQGRFFVGHMVAPGGAAAKDRGFVKNATAANPVWKDAVLFPMFQAVDIMGGKPSLIAAQDKLQDSFNAATPGSGAYLNEVSRIDGQAVAIGLMSSRPAHTTRTGRRTFMETLGQHCPRSRRTMIQVMSSMRSLRSAANDGRRTQTASCAKSRQVIDLKSGCEATALTSKTCHSKLSVLHSRILCEGTVVA
jgi:hypothetical protein